MGFGEAEPQVLCILVSKVKTWCYINVITRYFLLQSKRRQSYFLNSSW